MSAKGRQKVTYDFPRPALTVDVVIATRERSPRVLLIKRKHSPYRNKWALPGGFVDEGERLSEAAIRETYEETNVLLTELELLHAAGDPGRDPRGWVVSIVYLARIDDTAARAGDDAREAKWFRLDKLPPLAFDHAEILSRAAARLRDRTP